MNKLYAILCTAIIAASAILVSSCTCSTALPVLATGQSYISEAENALGQVEVMLNSSTLFSPDIKAKTTAALEKGHKGLAAAAVALRIAKDTCSSPDFVAIFADFNDAWGILRALIPTLGNVIGVRADGPTPLVPDPSVYISYRKA